MKWITATFPNLHIYGVAQFKKGVFRSTDPQVIARMAPWVGRYGVTQVSEDTDPPDLPLRDPWPGAVLDIELFGSDGKVRESVLPPRLSDVELRAAFGAAFGASLDSTPRPAPTVLVSDTFAGAAGTNLGDHAPTTGGAWSHTSSGNLILDGSGNVTQSGNATDGTIYVIDPGAENYTATFGVVGRLVGDDRSQAGVVFSYRDGNNFFHLEADLMLQAMVVYKRVAGTFTQLVQYALPSTVVAGQEVVVRLDHYGTDTTIWLDGDEVITVSEPEAATATGKIGLRVGGAGAVPAPAWTSLTVEAFRGIRLNLPRPVKYGGNPIIPLGAEGTWDDVDCNNPNVAWDPDHARWILYYSGYDAAVTNVQHMGVAYADNLYGPWTKEAANPVFTADAYDGIYAMNGGLVHWRGKWWHAYQSGNGGTIGMATATELTGPWTRHGDILTPRPGEWDEEGVYDAFLRVRQDGRTLELWYASRATGDTGRSLGYATSLDGLVFRRNDAATIPHQRFSGGNMAEPAVYVPPGQEGRQMMVTYDIVLPFASENRWIGTAITADGGDTWHHALLSRAGTDWEAGQNFDSFPMVQEGRFHLFYAATPGPGLILNAGIQIGVASCEWNGSTLIV